MRVRQVFHFDTLVLLSEVARAVVSRFVRFRWEEKKTRTICFPRLAGDPQNGPSAPVVAQVSRREPHFESTFGHKQTVAQSVAQSVARLTPAL